MNTFIITGANGNLGNAVTQKFLDSGYQVVATISNENDRATMPQHPQLDVYALNLTDADATAAFVNTVIGKYGQVHGAVMLVGGFAMGGIDKASVADLNKMFLLNFNTAYNITQPLFPHMQEKGFGRLIYIGARPALNAAEGKSLLAYGLSKSLLFKLAEYLNAEAQKTNVSATVVVPSTLDTVPNRKSMPDVNPDNWVKPAALADILELVCSEKGDVLRETVLKVYNNS